MCVKPHLTFKKKNKNEILHKPPIIMHVHIACRSHKTAFSSRVVTMIPWVKTIKLRKSEGKDKRREKDRNSHQNSMKLSKKPLLMFLR
jgi:hypothetical protein